MPRTCNPYTSWSDPAYLQSCHTENMSEQEVLDEFRWHYGRYHIVMSALPDPEELLTMTILLDGIPWYVNEHAFGNNDAEYNEQWARNIVLKAAYAFLDDDESPWDLHP